MIVNYLNVFTENVHIMDSRCNWPICPEDTSTRRSRIHQEDENEKAEEIGQN